MEKQNPRLLAALAVQTFEESGDFLGEILDSFIQQASLSPLDRGLFTELVYGTVRMKLNLDHIIQQFSSRKLRDIEPKILQVLRVGVYQLFYLDRIPARAAVHEAVNCARRLGRKGAEGFVNGILRGVLRGKARVQYPDPASRPTAYLSLRYSFPEWMVADWAARFGFTGAEELCQAFNAPPQTTLRVNTCNRSVEEVREHFQSRGAAVQAGRYAPDVITVFPGHLGVDDALFHQGAYYIQDEGSSLVAHAVNPQPGEVIHDLCSAPGGKATHMAQLMDDQGEIWAWDISGERLAKVEENARRQGFSIIKAVPGDASQPLDAPPGDRILVDAPCSGLGTLGHRPDIRWRRRPEEVQDLAQLQRKIMESAARLVKPGGKLVYSVCTITMEEGEGIAHWFLKTHPEFSAAALPEWFPEPLGSEPHMRLFLPHIHRIDGFFVAAFSRKK
jgi:16S rRNA (cytosine967-C5)-methyltransferase